MYLVISVIENTAIIPKLMSELQDNGICGATVIDSYGMGRILSRSHKDISKKDIISYVLAENRPTNRTVFVVVEKEIVQKAIDIFKEVVGDFSSPRTGILFTLKLDQVFK